MDWSRQTIDCIYKKADDKLKTLTTFFTKVISVTLGINCEANGCKSFDKFGFN